MDENRIERLLMRKAELIDSFFELTRKQCELLADTENDDIAEALQSNLDSRKVVIDGVERIQSELAELYKNRAANAASAREVKIADEIDATLKEIKQLDDENIAAAAARKNDLSLQAKLMQANRKGVSIYSRADTTETSEFFDKIR